MSKERLEEIKRNVSKQVYDRLIVPKTKVTIDYKDYKYLYEQAEQVEELEDHKSILQLNLNLVLKEKQRLEQQSKRYREALKNIYELAEYDEYDNTLEQIVSEVEKALEGEE